MPASRMRQVSDAPSSYFDVCAATAAVYPTPRRLLLPGCFAGLLAAPYAGVSRIVGQQAEALLALRVAPAPLLPQSSFTHEIAAFWPLRGPDNDHLVGEAASSRHFTHAVAAAASGGPRLTGERAGAATRRRRARRTGRPGGGP